MILSGDIYSMKKFSTVYLLMFVVPLIWSSNFVIGRVLVQHLPPFTITTARFGTALIILLAILKYKGLLKLPVREKIIPLALLGLTGIFGFNTILYIALKYTTAVNSTIINSFNPVVVAVLSALWLKENPGLKQMLGLLLSFLGIVVIATRGSWDILLSLSFNPGDILVFLNTFVWAFYTVMGRKIMSSMSPLEMTAFANLAGVLFLMPAMLYEWRGGIPALTPGQLLVLLYLAVFASVLGFLWWNKGVSEIGPARAAAFYNLIPVYAAVLAYFLLDERLYLYHLAGGIMVLSGVYLGLAKKKALDRAS